MEKDSNRKIIHIDMDAFYASVEERDNPLLKGKPLIISGPPNSRSVVCTCSYEARKFGIHSAMPASHAYKKCPQGIFIPPNMKKYKEASNKIRSIFLDYTDLIEPLSLDEAYLDVTQNKMNNPSATLIANEIRQRVKNELNLTCSAGVSYNKFIAKIASDYNKPDGITVVTPDQGANFVANLAVSKFFGIGKKTQEHMNTLNIKTGSDLKVFEMHRMIKLFGKRGPYFYYAARGIDNRPVTPNRERKSFGREITLTEDLLDTDQIISLISDLSERVSTLLAGENKKGRTITLKIKYHDFINVTRSQSFPQPINDTEIINKTAVNLLKKTNAGKKAIRLVGVSISGFPEEDKNWGQPELPLE